MEIQFFLPNFLTDPFFMSDPNHRKDNSSSLSNISSQIKSLFNHTDNRMIIDQGSNIVPVTPLSMSMSEDFPIIISNQDQLTGLSTRDSFLNHLEEPLKLSKENPEYMFSVLFLDLAHFKKINDSFGYKIGDQLLVAVSKRLKQCLRGQDFIARVGNDEFAILLDNIKDVNFAIKIAQRIGESLLVPFEIEGHEVFANIHIGIATNTKGYEQPEQILRNASIAIAQYHRPSPAGYQIFEEEMQSDVITKLRLENDLRKAIDRQEFNLHYQPIVCLQTQRIKGFETLARWQHPKQGLIAPNKFIPLAEETGLIIDLGDWVLYESCRQLYSWQQQFPEAKNWFVSVNVSAQQLLKPNFVEEVVKILVTTKLSPSCLKLEITESVLVENNDSLMSIFKKLIDLGIKFSLDDFGTGYSSLSYLHQFPIFHTLKIDRSFINVINQGNDKLAIVRAILALANSLGMDVVAEGIEENHQLAQLKVMQCQYGQGYLFSKPIDSKSTESLIISELAQGESVPVEDPKLLLKQRLSQENLLIRIEELSQEIEQLKQEKSDLEIKFKTTQEHASLIEVELQEQIDNYEKAKKELQIVNQKLESLSLIDGLTQVANRRHFDDYLQEEWDNLAASEQPISLILADVDYFKLYNDHYGHQGGDKCLQQVAKALSRPLKPPADLVARYGGEEFAIILPNTHADGALRVAQAIRAELRKMKIKHEKSAVNDYVTISLGIVNLIPSVNKSPESLVALADRALYEAKNQGRDRFILYSA
jgi:diguanylate cyclase (GGDEF)-like protein